MRMGAGAVVTGLTAGALVVLGFLGFRAAGSDPGEAYFADRGKPSASPSPGADGGKGGEGKKDEPTAKPSPPAVPDDSGTGKRVVYSLKAERVWLVEASGRVVRTYPVAPSSVSPSPGAYQVDSTGRSVTGSDGVAIENVVRFAVVDGVTIGFGAAKDGSSPKPDPEGRTGGVRSDRDDGRAMFAFAPVGTDVVVVE